MILAPCGLTFAVVLAATPGADTRRTLTNRPSPEIPRLTWPIGTAPIPNKRRMSAKAAGHFHLALAWDALRTADWSACLTHAAIASDLRAGDSEAERLTWIAEDRIESVTRARNLLMLPGTVLHPSEGKGRVLIVWNEGDDRWRILIRQRAKTHLPQREPDRYPLFDCLLSVSD